MKLVYFGDFRLGVLRDGALVDVSDVIVNEGIKIHPGDYGESFARPSDLGAIIVEWERFGPLIEEAAKKGPQIGLSEVRLRRAVPRPSSIDCMALNYIEDGSGTPPAPINGFQKPPSSLIGPDDQMVLPDVPGTVFEGEPELAIVVGKRGYRVPAAEAFDYVFGYVNLLDGSVRGLGPDRNNFYQMKSRETFCCVGPCVVTADEVPNPQELQIKLWNNGRLMHDFNTRDMAYDIARCIEFVSSLHTIEPGDLIATGTNHQGLHPFMDGDKITMEVEGLDPLKLTVRDDLKRTWERVTRGERQAAGLDPIAPQTGGPYAMSQVIPACQPAGSPEPGGGRGRV